MNEEQQRIAIAEACGWKWVNHPDFCGTLCWGWSLNGSFHTEDYYRSEKELASKKLPDYLNDFNAIYEAEKQLGLHDRNNLELRVKWVGILRDLVAPFCPLNKVGTPVVSDLDILTADVKIKAMALVKLTQKKKKK